MKTKFTLLAVMITAFFFTNAQQVPNGSFDNWTNSYTPTGWFTADDLAGQSIGHTFQDTVDKVEGTSSLEILSDTIPGLSIAGVVPGLASLGTGSYSPPNNTSFSGVYFPYRPDTIFYSYKYTTVSGDTAGINILMKHGSSIVLGGSISLDTTSHWINQYVVLTGNYVDTTTVPDTLLIQFLSSAGNMPAIGSTLHVDAVSFGYVAHTTGINAVNAENAVKVYPNPASDVLNVVSAGDISGSNMEIFDITGNLVSKLELEGALNNVNISNLANGNYIYKITNKSNGVISQNKFTVIK